jgi:predicted O-linked N-acetylglucosamine transferase (SPINDLY family)
VLGDILRRDPDGVLVLISPPDDSWQQPLIEARFRRAITDALSRVVFLPAMSMENYLGLLLIADALLDPPTFSGGNSSLEAFAMGAPVVTWPGDFLRGRLTLACYRQMGIDDLIAGNAEEYVGLALRLAGDADFRAAVRKKIETRADRLFDNTGFVRELEDFLEAAADARRRGEPPIRWPSENLR